MKRFLLVALIPAVALAQKPPSGCPLLTAAEISAITGMKAGEPHETDMDVPGGAGEAKVPMTGCMWPLGDKGMVNLSIMRASGSKEERDKGLAGLRQTYDLLKSKGWSVTETKLGDMLCIAGAPPKTGSDSLPAMTGCFAVRKGFVYSVGVAGPHFKVPPETVKALADNVVKRLP
jgi:hypothetical protein